MQVLIDMTELCTDYSLVQAFSVIQKAFDIICIFVPIILIVMASLSVVSLMTNPDKKNGYKNVFTKFGAAVIIFFLPYLVNVVMGFIPEENVEFSACWAMARDTASEVEETTYPTGSIGSKGGSLVSGLKELKAYKDQGTSTSFENNGKSKFGADIPTVIQAGKAGEVVNGALQYVGGRYVWGGGHDGSSTMEEAIQRSGGVDCSSFVRIIYKQFAGYDFGDDMVDYNYRTVGTGVSLKDARPGDIVCYSGHVAIYMGNNKIVHAKGRAYGIVQGDDVGSIHGGNILAIRRVL